MTEAIFFSSEQSFDVAAFFRKGELSKSFHAETRKGVEVVDADCPGDEVSSGN